MPDLSPESQFHLNSDLEILRSKILPVDYARILGNATILFLGENHHNFSIPDHVEGIAPDLKKAGITHFAIEADADDTNNAALELLNRGEDIDRLPFGLAAGTLSPFIYVAQIRAMAKEGIQVVAVDQLQYDDPEKRESFMTSQVLKILQDPSVKLAFRVGLDHANRRKDVEEGVSSVATRLSKEGFTISVVDFVGGDEVITSDEPRLESLKERIRKMGLAEQEFMFDMKTNPTLFPNDSDADYYIHLPQWID
jgi:hypothetical protein